jgi:hypothetical protein
MAGRQCTACANPAECKRQRQFLEMCGADCLRVQEAKLSGRLTFYYPAESHALKIAQRWGFKCETLNAYIREWAAKGMPPPKWWQKADRGA